MLTYYKSKEDVSSRADAQGSLLVANMKVEEDAGTQRVYVGPGSAYSSGIEVSCFAITPAHAPASEGHQHHRRIICGCELLSERKKWTDALAALASSAPTGAASRSRSNQVPPILEGFVWKQGDWRNPTYKKRWMVLRKETVGSVLAYYRSKEDSDSGSNLVGKMVVAGVCVCVCVCVCVDMAGVCVCACEWCMFVRDDSDGV